MEVSHIGSGTSTIMSDAEPQLADFGYARKTFSVMAPNSRSGARGVGFAVSWVVGLVEDPFAQFGQPTTWGLFKLSENELPEPLYGHVERLDWLPWADTCPRTASR